MREKSHISLGPGAASLILIFVMLSLSVLGILSLSNGKNDRQLSERSIEVAEEIYALNDRAEEIRADIAQILAEASEAAADEAAWLLAAAEGLGKMELSGEADTPPALSGEEIAWTVTSESGMYTLDCAVRMPGWGDAPAPQWIRHDLLTGMEEDEWNW